MTTELTKAAQQALMECPFCGADPQDAHHIEYGRWAVTCKCGASGASANTGPNATDAAKIKAYSDARTAWNTRALTQRPAAQTEREAFEAEMRCEETWGHRSLKKRPDGRYQNWQVDVMWEVWQARASLPAPQQATPEPVGEVVAWQRRDRNIVTGEWSEWREDDDIEEELDPEWAERRPLFTRPAPGVPEGFALVPVEPTEEMTTAVEHAMWDKPSVKGADVRSAVLAAAQAKGAGHA